MDFKVLLARSQAQTEAMDAVRANDYNGAIIASVGFGKGKVMIDLAQEMIQKYGFKKGLYVCDSRRLRDSDKDGFPQQLAEWGSDHLKKVIRLECYQTVCKWKNEEYDFLLADEADFAMTPVYSNLFFRNKFKKIIPVTGTLTLAKKRLLTQIVPIVFRCSTQDAEARGIINKSNYHVYNYKLTTAESAEYTKFNRRIAIASAGGNEKTLLYWQSQRKEFLFNLDSSYHHTRKVMRWLWERNRNTRLVVFSQRTEQADRLCAWSYHGKNEKDDNLAKFQSGEISAIAVVSKIRRGINLKNANTAIFEMLDGSTTEFEQRNGRLKRLPIAQLADIIFMCPWFEDTDSKGYTIYKETIVAQWIAKGTGNLTDLRLKDLKI